MVDIYKRKPEWLRVKPYFSAESGEIKRLMRTAGLHSVCEEASCPNIGECFKKRTAAFLILGDVCTRACTFCNVDKEGLPRLVNPKEPSELARTVQTLNLKHVVITSVTRDDLKDGGAEQFASCIKEIRKLMPHTSIEVLCPDFKGKDKALDTVISEEPDVFNHNLETIERLYKTVRKGADYRHSLHLLGEAKALGFKGYTKSGIMLGLGEEKEEVLSLMDDLRSVDVDILTIGQYLRPSLKHHEVIRYIPPEEFAEYKDIAIEKGFKAVSSSPLTRSSHNAFETLLNARKESSEAISQ